jgi:hypothetical protein
MQLREKEQESRLINSRLNSFSRNNKQVATLNGRGSSPKMIEINDESSHLPKIKSERESMFTSNMKR